MLSSTPRRAWRAAATSRESQSPTSPFLGRYCVSAKSRLTHGIPPLRNVGGAPITVGSVGHSDLLYAAVDSITA